MKVYLSYDRQDHAIVERIARRLRAEGIASRSPRWGQGGPRNAIREALTGCSAALVFIGRDGLMWRRAEVELLASQVEVITVLLPGAARAGLPSGRSVEFASENGEEALRELIDIIHAEGPFPSEDDESFRRRDLGFIEERERLPGQAIAAPPSPQATVHADTRSVCAQVLDPETQKPREALPPSGSGWLEIWIGWPHPLSARAPSTFPSQEVPLDDRTLTVVLSELSGGRGPDKASPAARKITLPVSPDQASDTARFSIQVGSGEAYRARVIVLHRNRVLQTWILRVPIGDSGAVKLSAEAQIQPSVTALDERRPFDAALVFNHDAAGVPGVTSITGDAVSFFEPRGLEEELKGISATLKRLTVLNELPGKLDDPAVLPILRALAQHGRLIWDLFGQKLGALSSAKRVQVIEAREGAYFPVEFFYMRRAPRDDAPLCPHALEALRSGTALNTCPTDDDSVVCPTAFWGFSRVIERWAHQTEVLQDRELELGVPRADRRNLDLHGPAVIGASCKVRKEDLAKDGAITRAVQAFTEAPPHLAAKWDDWRKEVREHSPALLVLLAHTLPHPEDDIASLEIGESLVRASGIESDYVAGPARTQAGPIVLLLGCSTTFAEVPFQNFVSRFRAKGAALVVGTLSVVLGRHAGSFANALLEALRVKVGTPDATFGDAFLAAKQSLLASGNPYALTVAAYGDAEWRI